MILADSHRLARREPRAQLTAPGSIFEGGNLLQSYPSAMQVLRGLLCDALIPF